MNDDDRTATRKPKSMSTYARNAQHGQNRTGVEVEADREFDEFEAAKPIEPDVADQRLRDEGEEIRRRAREQGYSLEMDEAPTKPPRRP